MEMDIDTSEPMGASGPVPTGAPAPARDVGLSPTGNLTITIGKILKESSVNVPRAPAGVPAAAPAPAPPEPFQMPDVSSVSYEEGALIGDKFVTYLEALYVANRHEIVTDDGINTPLAALRDLVRDDGRQAHFETHELRINEHLDRYMVEIIYGDIKGVGEANQKKLALQIAAADVLENYKKMGSIVPSYGLMPGFRINPSIFADLAQLCDALKLVHPVYIEMPQDPQESEPPLYTFKCQIGQLYKLGYNDSKNIAKRWAAKKMFEALTGEKIPFDRIEFGPYARIFERYGISRRPSSLRQKLIDEVRSRPGSRSCSLAGSVSGSVTGAGNFARARPLIPEMMMNARQLVTDEFYCSDEEEGEAEENIALKQMAQRMKDPQNMVTRLTQADKLAELQIRLQNFNFEL